MPLWLLLAQASNSSATDAATADGEKVSLWQSISSSWHNTTSTVSSVLTALVDWAGTVEGRLVVATLLGGIGIWLMLPGNRRLAKGMGGVLALMAAVLMLTVSPSMGLHFESIAFWSVAAITLAAAVATITSRSPVYCAIWFALMLLGTGGLFLVNGAQFLAVATVAVYAGAIVVTFLFVLMLAQPEGHSFYDRISWGKFPSLLACLAGVAFAAAIIWAVSQTPFDQLAVAANTAGVAQSTLAEQHVAVLGGRLFTKHLIAVQIAGTLLLAALVGAVAMATHGGDTPGGVIGRRRMDQPSDTGAKSGSGWGNWA